MLLDLIEPTRAEAGCLRYELLQSYDDPTEFTFVEAFEADAALAAHAAAPYIAGVGPRLAALTSRPSEVRRYRPADTAEPSSRGPR